MSKRQDRTVDSGTPDAPYPSQNLPSWSGAQLAFIISGSPPVEPIPRTAWDDTFAALRTACDQVLTQFGSSVPKELAARAIWLSKVFRPIVNAYVAQRMSRISGTSDLQEFISDMKLFAARVAEVTESYLPYSSYLLSPPPEDSLSAWKKRNAEARRALIEGELAVLQGMQAALRLTVRESIFEATGKATQFDMESVLNQIGGVKGPNCESQPVTTAALSADANVVLTIEDSESSRRATIDQFLEACSSIGPYKINRTHMWKAAGHTQARQFQHWQAADGHATDADEVNFRRILSMQPAEFVTLLKRKGVIEEV